MDDDPNAQDSLLQPVDDTRPGTPKEGRCSTMYEQYGSYPSDESVKVPGMRMTKQHKDAFFTGWRVGVSGFLILLMVVLMINVIFLIVVSSTRNVQSGIGTLHQGSCSDTETASIWLHLLINVLSTGMLSGSNYCMQRLSAPTRTEINEAHAKRKYLDIGIPSFRNLGRIGHFRTLLWMVLACSSLPLHLLYNSAIFTQITASSYIAFAVQSNFLTGAPFSLSELSNELGSAGTPETPINPNFPDEELLWLQAHLSELDRLDTTDCINAYTGADLIFDRGDVLLIGDVTPGKGHAPNNSVEASYKGAICPRSPCRSSSMLQDGQWLVGELTIAYCLSERLAGRCELQFSVVIMAVVVACNAIKIMAVLAMLLGIKSTSLVTLGDAMSSFLQKPDKHTDGMCMASKSTTHGRGWDVSSPARHWRARRHFWLAAVSKSSWIVCNFLCIAGIAAGTWLLCHGLGSITAGSGPSYISLIRTLGFGATSPKNVVSGSGVNSLGLISSTLLANTPQLLLSLLYFTYNAIFTCEVVGQEWNEYGYRRKPLRVSQPQGQQRSTYWLGLPYRYGVPLMAMSVLLHWLYSRSIYLINITYQDYLGQTDAEQRLLAENHYSDIGDDITQCGWSPLAVLLSVIFSGLTVLIGIAFGFRHYRPGIPLAGSNSAAISAACHPDPAEPSDAFQVPLRWGVTSHDGVVGHCTFSSGNVEPPNENDLYRGQFR